MDAIVTIGKVIAGFVAVILAMGAPFAIFRIVMDARQKERIRKRLSELGVVIDQIKVHKNHYGVSFTHAGSEFYVRCVPGSNGFQWLRDVPNFLVQPNDTVRAR
jgi:hypothetical protein